MPDYSFDFTVPANTPAASPAQLTVELNRGVLIVWLCWFKPGCAAMVRVQLYDGASIVLPTDAGQSYAFDGYVLERRLRHDLSQSPYELTLVGWSPGTTYPHALTIGFTLEDPDEERQRGLFGGLFGG